MNLLLVVLLAVIAVQSGILIAFVLADVGNMPSPEISAAQNRFNGYVAMLEQDKARILTEIPPVDSQGMMDVYYDVRVSQYSIGHSTKRVNATQVMLDTGLDIANNKESYDAYVKMIEAQEAQKAAIIHQQIAESRKGKIALQECVYGVEIGHSAFGPHQSSVQFTPYEDPKVWLEKGYDIEKNPADWQEVSKIVCDQEQTRWEKLQAELEAEKQ